MDQISRSLEVEGALSEQILDFDANENQLQEAMKRLADITKARMTLVDATGKVIADSDLSLEEVRQIENHKDRPEIKQALRGLRGMSIRSSTTRGREMLYIALPVHEKKSGEIHEIIRLALPLQSVKASLRSIGISIGAISALGFAGILAVVFFLGHHLRRRIREMVRMAEHYKNINPLDPIPNSGGNDEFELLSLTIQKIALSLKTRFEDIDTEKRKLLVVLENMVEGVIAVDHFRQVLMMNKSAASIFKTSDPHACLGKSLLQLTLNSSIDDMVRESIELHGIVSKEVDISRPETKILKMNAIGLSQAQGEIHAIVVVHDITQLRNLENMRREFVANVSHELRTPLTSINGFIETLLAGAVEDTDKREQFLKIIQDDAHRLSRLINDLLEISKLESKETPMNTRALPLPQQIRQVLKILQGQLEAKKITVENGIQDDRLLVTADEDRLLQVLINLIDNAIKFNKPEGWVKLRASRQKDLEQGRPWIKIEIEDSGIGIPQDKQARIFERFFRVDKGRSRQMGGTGLGLAIVKHIVEAHEGKIFCESRVNIGTQFTILLPAAAQAAEVKKAD